MKPKPHKCLHCGSALAQGLSVVFDTRFGIEDVYSIGECEGCGLEQTFPMPGAGGLKCHTKATAILCAKRASFSTNARTPEAYQ